MAGSQKPTWISWNTNVNCPTKQTNTLQIKFQETSHIPFLASFSPPSVWFNIFALQQFFLSGFYLLFTSIKSLTLHWKIFTLTEASFLMMHSICIVLYLPICQSGVFIQSLCCSPLCNSSSFQIKNYKKTRSQPTPMIRKLSKKILTMLHLGTQCWRWQWYKNM